MKQDNNSLAHTTWNCKYHIVFAQNTVDKLYMENIRQVSVRLYVNYVTVKE